MTPMDVTFTQESPDTVTFTAAVPEAAALRLIVDAAGSIEFRPALMKAAHNAPDVLTQAEIEIANDKVAEAATAALDNAYATAREALAQITSPLPGQHTVSARWSRHQALALLRTLNRYSTRACDHDEQTAVGQPQPASMILGIDTPEGADPRTVPAMLLASRIFTIMLVTALYPQH